MTTDVLVLWNNFPSDIYLFTISAYS